jgi:hypothetical protein
MIAGQIVRPHCHFRLVVKVRLAQNSHTNLLQKNMGCIGVTNATTRKTRYTVFTLAIPQVHWVQYPRSKLHKLMKAKTFDGRRD